MVSRKLPDPTLHERFTSAFDTIHRSRFARWLLGVNVIVASLTAGFVSAGMVLVTIVEREFAWGVIAVVASTVSAATKSYESYRRKKVKTPARLLGDALKRGYRNALNDSRLYKETAS